MMKLSFIIPIFNLEGYIEDCIHSLLNQNIPQSEYEIICVNDGSTDTTLEILQKLASSFSNIVIINQENKGVSAARNNGMRYAKGEYIWFVDGDDLIIRNCLKQLISFLDEKSLPLIRFDIKLVLENYKITEENNFSIIKPTLINSTDLLTPMVCCHIYRKSIIENDFNTELKIYEDGLFTSFYQFKYYPYYKINYKIYYYRQRATSVTHDKRLSSIEQNVNNTYLYYKEIKKRKNIYIQSDETSKVYNKMITSIQASYLFDILKLPPEKFNIYFELAINSRFYPLKGDLSCLIQKTFRESDLKTKINIRLGNLIKICIALGINCKFLNRAIYFFYKKNYKQ